MMIRLKPVIAHHLILSGYGFWLANDPRGSGSEEVREKKFEDLGEIHRGRKPEQPTREELREFYRKATPRLEHAPLWFDERSRHLIGEAFGDAIARCGYSCWACFVGSNHAHLCIRKHRDPFETIWPNLAEQARVTLAAKGIVSEVHPVWADRPFSVFCYTPADIRRIILYINRNPAKEGLAAQTWGFVKEYDGWPVRK